MLVIIMVIPAVNADVVINEIMANAITEDTGEFVELYNTGTTGVDIAGWLLTDPVDTNDLIEDYSGVNNYGTSGTIIPAGGYALIVDPEYAGEYNGYLTANVAPADVIMVTVDDTTIGNELAAGGDTITLNNGAVLIDTYTWTTDAGNGFSWERTNPLADVWEIGPLAGTPGDENSVYEEALEITDVVHTPQYPTVDDNVNICAAVNNVYPLQTIDLHWDSAGIGSATVAMYDFDGDGTYCRALSADTLDPEDGSKVDYYVTVMDVNGNFLSTESDPEFPEQFYFYDGAVPTADFICSPTTGTEPLTVICSSTSSDSVYSREELEHDWIFYGGIPGISTDLSVEVEYTVQGVTSVTLIVTDPAGRTDTETKTNYISIQDSTPNADFSWTPILPMDNQQIIFDGRASDGPMSYDTIEGYCWDFDDGSAIVCDGNAACCNGDISCTTSGGSCAIVKHTYTTGSNYQVTLTVTDVDGPEEGTTTKTVAVNYIDDAPVVAGIPDQIKTEDGVFDVFDLDNYLTELDGEDITWTYGGNSELSVSINEIDNIVTISAPDNWNGFESITFVATDVLPGEESDFDTAVFTMTPVNDAPVVGDILGQTINEGEAFTTFDLDNFLIEVDGDDISWSYSGNSPLTVTIDAENVVTVAAPSSEWNGVRTLAFTATDDNAEALFDSDSATFTVNGVNQNPTLSIPDDAVAEDSGIVAYDLTDYANDAEDVDEDLTFNLDSQSDSSMIECELDGQVLECTTVADQVGTNTIQITVTDTEGGEGTDSFTITVTEVNDAPAAVDDADETAEETMVFIAVLANDNDAEDDTLTITDVTEPTSGTAVISDDGNEIEYIPETDFYGIDTFDYTINDGNGGTDTGTVTVTVTNINDAPVVLDIPDQTVDEGESFTTFDLGDYLTNVDEDEIIWSYSGDDQLTVNIGDDNVVTISPPDEDWSGTETITFTATDDNEEALSDSDEAVFTVNPINDAPAAVNDAAATAEETMVSIAVLTNDSDAEDDTLTITGITTLPTSGTAVINGDNIEYTPATNFYGIDTFVYTISDGTVEGTDTATVTVTVTNVNDAPVLELPDEEDIPEMTENGLYTLTLTVSDPDNTVSNPDEDELILTGDVETGILENLEDLEFTDNEDGTWDLTFTPDYGLVEHTDRSREFDMTIILNDGTITDEQTFTVTANDVNRAPEIEEIETIEFTELDIGTYQVTANDLDGDDLIYELTDEPEGMTIGTTGLISWTPELGQEGIEDITVIVSDAPYSPLLPGDSETAEVTFDVDIVKAFEISMVRVNNILVEEGEASTALRPAQEAEIEISLTNNLDHPIIGAALEFDSTVFDLTSGENTVNLGSGETETITLTEIVPYTVIEGEYEAVITANGDDYEVSGLVHTDSFDFLLNIDQNPAEIIISNLELADEELICKDSTDLTFQLTNVGEQNEDDIFITVTTPSGLELTDGPLIINQNARRDFTYEIPSEELSSGDNPLTVEVSYRNNFETVTDDSLEITKNGCLDSYTPTDSELIIADCVDQEFTVELNEDDFESIVHWYVDDVEVGTGLSYTFNECEPGVYDVEVIVDADGQETNDWTVTVTDMPISDDMDISTNPFVLENQYARVEYDEQPDLGDLVDIDAVARLTEGQVAIDGITAEELEGAATITIKKNYVNPIILISTGFGSGTFIECPTTVCRLTSNAGGWLVFEVDGFSIYRTYRVEEEAAPAVDIPEINFNQATRGTTATVNVVITNLGTHEPLTGLSASLENITAGYNVRIVGNLPTTLAARASATLQLQIDVPVSEGASRHTIGNLRVISTEDSETEAIYLSTRNYLTIENVDINGDENGDLKIDGENEFDVTLKNGYTHDLEDVEVTVTILDVDGDDLDETADEQDVGAGDDEEFSVSIDLSGEEIDEEEYTILIEAEGTAEDGTRHEASETVTAKLDLESHKVIIDRAELTFNALQCSRQTGLRITVQNMGKNAEDDVELKVKNNALKMDLSKTGIEVEEFTDSDNKETEVFHFNLEGAQAGEYPLNVELYRDSDLEDSKIVDLKIMECLDVQIVSQTQQTQPTGAVDDLATQLQDQLQQQLYGQLYLVPTTDTVTTTVKTGFRDSATYMIILGSLVFLIFIAILMALAVMLVKGKRRRNN